MASKETKVGRRSVGSVVRRKARIPCTNCNFLCNDSSKLAEHIHFSRPGPPLLCHLCEFQCCTSSGIMGHRIETHFSLALNVSLSNIPACDSRLEETSPTLTKLESKTIHEPAKIVKIRRDKAKRKTISAKRRRCVRLYKCKHCSYTCTDSTSIRRHEKSRRGRLYRCSRCSRKYCNRNIRTRHKKLCCERAALCDAEVAVEEERRGQSGSTSFPALRLRRPSKPVLGIKKTIVYQRERSYACSYCKKRFYNKWHLSEHVRTHTGEKPFKCEKCSYSSANSSGLHLHKRRGSSTAYPCSECNFKSCTESFLGAHMKRGHPEVVAALMTVP